MYPIETKKLVMTSGYGKRTYTIDGRKVTDFHHGIDLVGGEPVIATADGIVVKVVNKGKKGGTMCQIRIQHADFQSAYYHVKSGSIKYKVGDYVSKGSQIATIGNTGKVTGTHLHYQIDEGSNSTSINPYDYVFGDLNLSGLSLGNWEIISPRYVRTGAGTEYRIKHVFELTTDGQLHCVDKHKNAKAQYEKGTIFTAKKIVVAKNGSIWCETPSGFVCLISSTGKKYCKKK